MIFFTIYKMPDSYLTISQLMYLKVDLEEDEDFVNNKITKFQKNMLDKTLNICRGKDYKIYNKSYLFKNDFNFVKESLFFLMDINLKLYEELQCSIKNKRLYVDDSKKRKNFSGSCYNIFDKNFYEVNLNEFDNTFLNINHELVHGYVFKETPFKFVNDKLCLYREVASILIELYSNDYLIENGKISYEEFLTNINDLYLRYIYDDIELINILYRLANLSFTKNIKNVKKVLNNISKEKPNYDFKIKELNKIPLKHLLIYLYSTGIALSFYNNYKDNKKEGINAAIDFMLNIDENNEQELFKKYNINFNEGINSYIDLNNSLVKKKNS